ncbi:hypothetical protein BRE01_65790 [Brevibacillus reuszeri]|uniref:Uncharacterized protein n=2 Tax=Brevibacillus reuszeri TaxID=54915 RepID=A0ABQ0TY58_9BACL|nr:hypothetical protein BRE01_65790 [Brevibacillus reuszeri]
MAICVEFERVSSKGSLAYYRYGSCGHGDGLFELDYKETGEFLEVGGYYA